MLGGHNKRINQLREEMSFFKQNRQLVGQGCIETIENASQQIQADKQLLKKQLFFLQHLVPASFQKTFSLQQGAAGDLPTGAEGAEKDEEKEGREGKEGERACRALAAYSLNELKRPLPETGHSVRSSYQDPYLAEVNLRGKTHAYPADAVVYDDGEFSRL